MKFTGLGGRLYRGETSINIINARKKWYALSGVFVALSIFALGIMPYITASIIMQVLNVVIPKLQEWQEMGAVGQRKITQWTRYVAIAIALLQGSGLTFIFGQGNHQSRSENNNYR